MKFKEYIEKIEVLQIESKYINDLNEINKYVLNDISQHDTNNTNLINGGHSILYHSFYIDTDLLVNALEQQKEKNEARLNEIKQEISKLQKEDIQL